MKKKLGFLLAAIILSSQTFVSCATMFNGSTEDINVSSQEDGTTLYLDGQAIGKNQARVTVTKKKLNRNMVIRGSKPGCQDVSTNMVTAFDATSLLGIFWDLGIFTIGLVDGAATGAVTKAEKTSYDVTPICN